MANIFSAKILIFLSLQKYFRKTTTYHHRFIGIDSSNGKIGEISPDQTPVRSLTLKIKTFILALTHG